MDSPVELEYSCDTMFSDVEKDPKQLQIMVTLLVNPTAFVNISQIC